MGKSDNQKQQLKQFVQDLNLPRGKVRDWIHRLIERRVPHGAICLALQGKLLADELVGLSQYRLLMSGLTVPFSRLENWLKFWRFPRHFWRTLLCGLSAVEPSSETAELGDAVCLWDTARLLRLGMRKAEMSAPGEVTFTAEERGCLARFYAKHWEEFRAAMIEELRELHAEILAGTPAADELGVD